MACRCGIHAGSVYLSFWINSVQCYQQSSPYTITPLPPCFTVGTMHVETICSPFLRCTKTRQVEPKISNLDSSDQSIDFHWSKVYSLCFSAQTNLFCLLLFLSIFLSTWLTKKAWFKAKAGYFEESKIWNILHELFHTFCLIHDYICVHS